MKWALPRGERAQLGGNEEHTAFPVANFFSVPTIVPARCA